MRKCLACSGLISWSRPRRLSPDENLGPAVADPHAVAAVLRLVWLWAAGRQRELPGNLDDRFRRPFP